MCGRMPWFSSRTTTSTSSRDACASRSRGRCCPTSCTSVARAGGVARPARADSSRAPRRRSPTTSSVYTERVATRLRRLVRGRARAGERADARLLAAPISVDAEEFEALAESLGRARPRGRAASGASRAADPASRPRRPGEERGSVAALLNRFLGARPNSTALAAALLDPRASRSASTRSAAPRSRTSRGAHPAFRPRRLATAAGGGARRLPSPSPRTSSSTFCSSTRYATA